MYADTNFDALLKVLTDVPVWSRQALSLSKQLAQKLEELRIQDTELASKILSSTKRLMYRTYPQITQHGAQDGEDKILEKLLPQPRGWYVDVGASAPIECSNTWKFYTQGWRGLLIEPLSDFWPALLTHRRGDWLAPEAASDVQGVARLHVSRAISSLHGDWDLQARNDVMVVTDTLANILDHYPPELQRECRLCSIDVEGHERAVLRGIDWKTFSPDVFCIEYRRYDPERLGEDLSPEWDFLLIDHDYEEVERTSLNVIYRRKTKPAPAVKPAPKPVAAPAPAPAPTPKAEPAK